jgi:uncharacterized protein GlcG (DUF336 family)
MITTNLATQAIEIAQQTAQNAGLSVTTTVVDDHGLLIASQKMDGAFLISPEFSATKAYTAAVMGLPTSTLAGYSGQSGPIHGLTSVFGGKLTSIAGGIPVLVNGRLVGAIGVGGSTDPSDDEKIAAAAAQFLTEKLAPPTAAN